jgi:hypothetical protein
LIWIIRPNAPSSIGMSRRGTVVARLDATVTPKDVKLPRRSTKGGYDDVASIENRRWIPERF